jgi:hypothetical protein
VIPRSHWDHSVDRPEDPDEVIREILADTPVPR